MGTLRKWKRRYEVRLTRGYSAGPDSVDSRTNGKKRVERRAELGYAPNGPTTWGPGRGGLERRNGRGPAKGSAAGMTTPPFTIDVACSHLGDMPTVRRNVCSQGQSGRYVLKSSSSQFDPERTLKALKAKSLRCRWRYLGRTMHRQCRASASPPQITSTYEW
jgi:hypothetical protein